MVKPRDAAEVLFKFDHPPVIDDVAHVEVLKARGISVEFALASGISSRCDNELRKVGFGAGLSGTVRNSPMQGICITYIDPWTKLEVARRLRPDTPFILGDKPAKYVSRVGDHAHVFFPADVTTEQLEDTKIPIVITEAEFKALAIAEAFRSIKKKWAAIGLAGVNGGWHREKEIVTKSDGSHEKQSHGPAMLIDDLKRIEWKGRQVCIVFDSDVGTPKHAVEFKRSKHAGAMGAEHILAELIRTRGGDVRIVVIPHPMNGEKVGADDFIVAHGAFAFYRLINSNWVSRRNPDEIIYKPAIDVVDFKLASELANAVSTRPVYVIGGILPVGGTAIVAGAPKLGKSGIVMNAAKSVCEGGLFLGVFPCVKGNVAYIQTEIPQWALSERLKKMGDVPAGLFIWSPRRFHVNKWVDQGMKRIETGNDERCGELVNILRSKAVSLVIFDPFTHFHGLNENNVEHMSHVFEIFQAIARLTPCGILLVHHHRKVARSESKYQGAEDMRGSMALYAEPDAVMSIYAEDQRIQGEELRRFKLVTETRHSEKPDDLELLRYGGEQAWLWKAEPWKDGRAGLGRSFDDAHDRILTFLDDKSVPQGPGAIMGATGIPKSTFYRKLNELEKMGKIRNLSGLYLVPRNGDDFES